jgi:phosphoglycerate dehydrogenase-like enzyme
VAENASLREGGWQRHVGDDLAGRTLGLLGLGHIGGAVARIGKAFDMNVIAWSQNLTPERAADFGAVRVSKEELFRRADILSIHLVSASISCSATGLAASSARRSFRS